jgi:predicted PhzF superfamily epimerase YddE/YHI9
VELDLFQVDAFTRVPLRGNPAAVCPLGEWLDEPLLQAIARENNLSETAFLEGGGGLYRLRWFSPAAEVDLCGHATLASAWVVFHHLEPGRERVRFETKSGPLDAWHEGARIVLDFPSRPPRPCDDPPPLEKALFAEPQEILDAPYWLAVLATEREVRELAPDMALLERIHRPVIATAPGTDCDFVSRFFAPALGIPEDPVTGSAHCTLVPYWSARLDLPRLFARQLSPRGGELWCEDKGERVRIAGEVAPYLEGRIRI